MTWKPQYEVLFTSPKVSNYALVIPVINEGIRLQKLLDHLLELGTHQMCDIVITDGGSTDGSVDIDLLQAKGVKTLLRKVGFGKLGTQLQCAYNFALERGYSGVVTIDGNNKDNPATITEMMKLLAEGFDFVQGSRFVAGGSHRNTPLARFLAIKLVHAPLLSISSGFHWTDTTQGFRAYSSTLLNDSKLDIFRPELFDYKLLFYISHRAPKLGLKCTELGTERVYPRNESTPTKIKGFSGNLEVLKNLVAVALGQYDK